MPASLPGDSLANNILNPTLGSSVLFDLLSGPKGSPNDHDDTVLTWDANNHPVYTQGTITKATTGGLSTGIGYGSPPIIGLTAPASIVAAGFTDNYTPGQLKNDGTTATTDATYMYIGGGRSDAPTIATYGAAIANPYTAGYGIGMAGQGGSRDAGAGPAYTGFTLKMVTATGAVATGAAVEAGFTNRSGAALVTGQSVFGSSTTASAAVA